MFKIHINNKETETPTDDIYYIVAKEGIFLKKKLGIMESIAPVKNISILESVNTMARMHIKKIPGTKFARTIAFFKEVYKQYFAEAIVLLFYDEKLKTYKIVAPPQKVTASACDYNKGMSIEGMQMIGTIHSHAAMSAFHSGTDDKDEQHFDGLHITIGNLNKENVSITASIVANGHRFVVEPEEYIERLKVVEEQEVYSPLTRTYQYISGQLVETSKTPSIKTNVKKHSYYTVDVSDKYHKVIDKWMKMVEKGTYIWNIHSRNQNFINRWGDNYHSNFWYDNEFGYPLEGNFTIPKPHQIGQSVAPIVKGQGPVCGPQIELDKDTPCYTCKHKNFKLLIEKDDDIDDDDVFICKQCEAVISDDPLSHNMPICPNCKTDDYMILLDEDSYPDHYKSETEVVVKEEAKKVISSYIKCSECGNVFNLFHGETTCPFCYHDLKEKEGGEFSTEDELIKQASIDSGNRIMNENEVVNQAALKEITSIKIQDPEEETIPIPESDQSLTMSEQKEKDGLLYMFKRIFGGANK